MKVLSKMDPIAHNPPAAPAVPRPAAQAGAPAASSPSATAAPQQEALQDAVREARTEPENETIEEMVARANQMAEAARLQVRYRVDPSANLVQIQMYNPIDGTVIRNIPDTGLRDMMARIQDLIGGLMVDRRV